MKNRRLTGFIAMAGILLLLAACSPGKHTPPHTGYGTFAEYQAATKRLLTARRQFLTTHPAEEICRNMPREWRPAGKPIGGIILVHGLGDSPWSFVDLGPMLARRGYVVRTLLLPGHGTRPADLMHINLRDWQRVLRTQTIILQGEVPRVFLGGFSTGANLVTTYALEHKDIAGLLLFSPAFQAKSSLVWLTPFISPFRPWLREPGPSRVQQTTVRYLNVPTRGFALFYQSSRSVVSHLQAPYARPVLIATVAHDSVVDTAYTLKLFNAFFTHPDSTLIWYGALPAGETVSPRIHVKTDALPQQRISQFSHMGLLFSPDNPLYGAGARQKFCWNGQSQAAFADCQAGKQVWFSDWGYQEPGKIYARLTFNPYWLWQSEIIGTFLQNALPVTAVKINPGHD